MAVRGLLHQVELQRGERGPVHELPGGAGGDLAAQRRDGPGALTVPQHALRLVQREY